MLKQLIIFLITQYYFSFFQESISNTLGILSKEYKHIESCLHIEKTAAITNIDNIQ